MLADPRRSQLVLINPARCVLGKRPAGFATRWHESLSLLPHVLNIFGLGVHAAGSFDPGLIPVRLADAITMLDTDGLSLWQDERFTAHLSAAGIGVLFFGGAWLEEDVLIAALQGARLGYDVRLLADLSRPRDEAMRPLVLDRLALHGVLSTTVRQAMLEWAVCFEDPVVMQKVQQLLASGADGLS